MIKNINANECFKALKESENSKLIDVRTDFEWKSNGYADLTSINQKVNLITWVNENGNVNENFIEEVKNLDINKDTKLFFICKSGVRSNHAGSYINENSISENIFNVEGGMEFGWKISNLPVKI